MTHRTGHGAARPGLRATLNDGNAALMEAFAVVRDDVDGLVAALDAERDAVAAGATHAREEIEVDAVGEAGPRPLPPERPRHVGPEVVAAQRADLAAAPAHASTPSASACWASHRQTSPRLTM